MALFFSFIIKFFASFLVSLLNAFFTFSGASVRNVPMFLVKNPPLANFSCVSAFFFAASAEIKLAFALVVSLFYCCGIASFSAIVLALVAPSK